MNLPVVSIILPTNNGGKERFKKSVNSVLNQSFKDFELIIINDASTNDIEKTIKEVEKIDDRVVYIKNEKNLKLTKTLNKWISIAKWKYIARIDDDDEWIDEKKLEKQVNFLEKNKNYWIVWTNAKIINNVWEEQHHIVRPSTDKEIRENMLVWCRFIHSSVLIRKTILDRIWWYDPKWNMSEDYELRLRIWLTSKMHIFQEDSVLYIVNTNWITSKNYRKQKLMALKLFFKYYKYYPKTHIIKALCFRLWEWIIPYKRTRYIIKKIKNIKI